MKDLTYEELAALVPGEWRGDEVQMNAGLELLSTGRASLKIVSYQGPLSLSLDVSSHQYVITNRQRGTGSLELRVNSRGGDVITDVRDNSLKFPVGLGALNESNSYMILKNCKDIKY